MQIAGLLKFSTVDYPGKLSAVVFTAECNWNCWYCHNRQLIDTLGSIRSEDVLHFLEGRAGLLDGVCISGGEPTLQDDLPGFLRQIRDLGYSIKLDTNGSHPRMISDIVRHGLADYFAVDLKAPPERYEDIGGGNPADVRSTVDVLRTAGVSFEVRTTITPDLGADDLRTMCRYVGAVPLYALQLYRPVQEGGFQPATRADLEALRAKILDLQPCIVVRA